MKILRLLLKTFVFFVGLVIAAWIFMPWKQVGEYAFSKAAAGTAGSGTPLSFSEVETADSGFTVSDVSVGGFMKASFRSVTFRPDLLGTLLNMAPTCRVSFAGGEMVMMSSPIRFGNGRFLAVATPKEIFLDELRTDGEFSISGFLGINPVQKRISRAEAAIKTSEALESSMEFLKNGNILPLVQDGPGRWFLRRVSDTQKGQPTQ